MSEKRNGEGEKAILNWGICGGGFCLRDGEWDW